MKTRSKVKQEKLTTKQEKQQEIPAKCDKRQDNIAETQKKETSELQEQPPTCKNVKLFSIFEPPSEKKIDAEIPKKNNETKSRKNPILDKKLAPDTRSFLQPRKSLGSSLTNAIKVKTSANPGIENHVVYTCTQSQNGDSNPEINRKLHE